LVSLVVERALPEQAGMRGRGRGIRWSFSLDILSGVHLLSSPYTACASSAPIFLVLEHGIILHLFQLSYSSPKVEFSDRVSLTELPDDAIAMLRDLACIQDLLIPKCINVADLLSVRSHL